MKQIKEQVEEVGINAHTAGADKDNGERILPTYLQKFKDVESLCKAYNSLQSEFTKRCQRIKELEGKLEPSLQSTNDNDHFDKTKIHADLNVAAKTCDNGKISADQTKSEAIIKPESVDAKMTKVDDNRPIEALIENNSAKEGAEDCALNNKEVCLDKSIAPQPQNSLRTDDREGYFGESREVVRFFKDYPEAAADIGELENICNGDYGYKSLQNAYIQMLKKSLYASQQKGLTEAEKLTVIKDYLNSLRRLDANSGANLLGGNGVIPVTPPVRPKNIAEAGALAQNIIKFR